MHDHSGSTMLCKTWEVVFPFYYLFLDACTLEVAHTSWGLGKDFSSTKDIDFCSP